MFTKDYSSTKAHAKMINADTNNRSDEQIYTIITTNTIPASMDMLLARTVQYILPQVAHVVLECLWYTSHCVC